MAAVLVCAVGVEAVAQDAPLARSGDSIDWSGDGWRLKGISAPAPDQTCLVEEERQPCGLIARAVLAALLAVEPDWRCRAEPGASGAGERLATCTAGTRDLAGQMVAAGWALDRPGESGGAHGPAEAAARAAGRGLWAGRFEDPAAWRRRNQVAAGAAPEDPACTVKGDITTAGARIYHLPGSRFYAGITIDPAAGETWFCSPAQAEAAGWRRALR